LHGGEQHAGREKRQGPEVARTLFAQGVSVDDRVRGGEQ
jgi:hypothetical protein